MVADRRPGPSLFVVTMSFAFRPEITIPSITL